MKSLADFVLELPQLKFLYPSISKEVFRNHIKTREQRKSGDKRYKGYFFLAQIEGSESKEGTIKEDSRFDSGDEKVDEQLVSNASDFDNLVKELLGDIMEIDPPSLSPENFE